MSANLDSVTDRENIHQCRRCKSAYDWRRSASTSLKMTYCGTLCEVADLGFAVDELLRCLERTVSNGPPAVPVAVRTIRLGATSDLAPAA